MNIYVASSWRNSRQPEVVQFLRELGHEVYDFKNPPGATGFSWAEIDPNWRSWTADQFADAIEDQRAVRGFTEDMNALRDCDVCVLVLPCGRSAHLELGYAVGAGKKTVVLLDDPISEPELMYRMCTMLAMDMRGLKNAMRCVADPSGNPWKTLFALDEPV